MKSLIFNYIPRFNRIYSTECFPTYVTSYVTTQSFYKVWFSSAS